MAEKLPFSPEKYSNSRYSTVIGLAKRAREISEEAFENKEILSEKPVIMAMRELVEGKYKILPAKGKWD